MAHASPPVSQNNIEINTRRHVLTRLTLHRPQLSSIPTTSTMAVSASTPADEAKAIAEAQKNVKDQPAKAEATYKSVLSKDPGSNDAAIRNFENALVSLGELYRDQKRVKELAELVEQTRSVMSKFAKAKTAKLGMQSRTPDLYSYS